MRKITIVLLFYIGLTNSLTAQQDAQYTQYMYNTLSFNPAYAGSRGVLSISGLHRSQWVGFDGAPTTQTFNMHAPVSSRVGLGFSVVNDEIGNGTSQDTYFDLAFSYTIPFSGDAKLSFGVNAGGHVLNLDFNRLENFRPAVTTTQESTIDNKFSPNFGAGFYYHTNRFYTGFSIPKFLETSHFDTSGESTSLINERLNLYFISGFVADINSDWKMKPALLVKVVDGAPLQVDVSANFLFREKLTLGVAYRYSAAWSALSGYQLNDKIMFGLAYDKETTRLGNTSFNNGSFELFLRFELITKYRKVISSRFF